MSVRRVLIAAAGVLLLAGCASGVSGHAGAKAGAASSDSAAQQGATVVRTFTPYTASGKLTVPVQSRTSGHCWEISLAAPAPDAYRCLAHNQILDPCFAPPGASADHVSAVACFENPWSKAVLLHVHRLPKATPPTTRPWAVVLGSDVRCVAVTGTAPFVDGVGLDYTCGHGTAAALRDVGGKQVHALVGHIGGHSLTHAVVRTIWRG